MLISVIQYSAGPCRWAHRVIWKLFNEYPLYISVHTCVFESSHGLCIALTGELNVISSLPNGMSSDLIAKRHVIFAKWQLLVAESSMVNFGGYHPMARSIDIITVTPNIHTQSLIKHRGQDWVNRDCGFFALIEIIVIGNSTGIDHALRKYESKRVTTKWRQNKQMIRKMGVCADKMHTCYCEYY